MMCECKNVLCRPKMIECIYCKLSKTGESFCFEKECACNVPQAVVSNNKIICYIDN